MSSIADRRGSGSGLRLAQKYLHNHQGASLQGGESVSRSSSRVPIDVLRYVPSLLISTFPFFATLSPGAQWIAQSINSLNRRIRITMLRALISTILIVALFVGCSFNKQSDGKSRRRERSVLCGSVLAHSLGLQSLCGGLPAISAFFNFLGHRCDSIQGESPLLVASRSRSTRNLAFFLRELFIAEHLFNRPDDVCISFQKHLVDATTLIAAVDN